MPVQDILIVYLISILLVFLPSYGLSKLFPKAGQEAWKAYVPFYNTWVMQEIAGRPKHWVFWQFIPVVGWFITPGIFIEFAKVFNRFSFLEHICASLFAPFYFPWLAQKVDAAAKDTGKKYGKDYIARFIGPEAVRKHKKAAWREWVDAAIFAIVAATLIRTFIFEAYTIPTSSMEKTLLVKDFLFVSKLSYGTRIPNTPLSVPFLHNYMPGSSGYKSYSTAIEIPYRRWFASPVKRNDNVVFNYPEGDTVINRPDFQSAQPYYDIIRNLDGTFNDQTRQQILSNPDYPIAVHPVDKTDNYIKRCVGIAGDSIKIVNGILYVNNEPAFVSPTSATYYTFSSVNNVAIGTDYLTDAGIRLNQNDGMNDFMGPQGNSTEYKINLTLTELEILKKLPLVNAASIKKEIDPDGIYATFPQDTTYFKNSRDNFEQIWIPKKGGTVQLTPKNMALYRRAIGFYEHNKLEERGGKVFINGQEATTYTFKMDYYWMMGDNRHKSQDSRYWGFVPEDRIVGKAWMIWFSWENGPRWKRLFNIIK
ncbi:signal peptidase I [Terrimonas rubra]|uniref:Signal peptidase I n=1 Tax=Terrimonas rubra TaxID=1035890 RepID=A0ABW6AA32_9BACT